MAVTRGITCLMGSSKKSGDRRITCLCLLALVGGLVFGCGGTSVPVKEPSSRSKKTAGSQRVQKKCNRSLGVCEYRVLPDVAASRSGKLSMLCSVIVPVATPTLARIEMGLQTSGNMIRFRECHELALTVDGKPLPARDTTYHSALGTGFVVEAATLPLTAQELSSLTTANKIDYQLCSTRGTIGSADHDLLRAMYLLWKAQ